MKRLIVLSAVMLLSCAGATADDQLEIGASVREFYVKDVTGPAAGMELCYRCRYANRPVVTIFTRDVNDELAALIKKMDEVVGENGDAGMAGFVVLMTDEPAEHEDSLKSLATEQDIRRVPLTVFDDRYGPRSYRLSRDADVTVMMWVEGELAVNQSFKREQLTEDAIAGLVRSTERILN